MRTIHSLPYCLLALALMTHLPASAADKIASGGQYLVYFGTYTGPVSKGIYVSRYDAKSGKLEPAQLAVETASPSWVAVHPNQKFLYAAGEQGSGDNKGEVSSFAIDAATGQLKFLNKVPAAGNGPCHLVIDKKGKTISVANYGSGSVAVFRLQEDGMLGERTAMVQHEGSSVNKQRQSGPHAHAVVLSPDEKFLFVPDLGLDRLMAYRFDTTAGTLTANEPAFAAVTPGGGPRHLAFHPKGKFAYHLNEMASTLTAWSYDKRKGAFQELQTMPTLPAGFTGNSSTAEVEVDRRGRFVYGSNRGDDSIAVFAIDGKQGKLTQVQRAPTQGKTPRNFKLDPTGNHLLAANQNSGNVAVFRVDSKTGELTPTGQVLDVPAPVCVAFVPLGS